MEKDIVDYALEYARSKEVHYAEVRVQSEKLEQLMLKDRILEESLSSVNGGFLCSSTVDGGIDFASTNKWTREEAKAISRSILTSRDRIVIKMPYCPECGGEMKYLPATKHYVCKSCGLSVTRQELMELRQKLRPRFETGEDEQKQRRKEYLKWWLSKKK